MSEKRAWVLTALWFGTIALVGLLKKALERPRTGRAPRVGFRKLPLIEAEGPSAIHLIKRGVAQFG